MTALIDTSVLVRYFTGDPPSLFAVARAVIDNMAELAITDVVIEETAHVLLSTYRMPRAQVIDGLAMLLRRENIEVLGLNKGTVLDALMLARPSGRVSPGDAMIWAAARDWIHGDAIYTFDRRFPSDGVVLRDSV